MASLSNLVGKSVSSAKGTDSTLSRIETKSASAWSVWRMDTLDHRTLGQSVLKVGYHALCCLCAFCFPINPTIFSAVSCPNPPEKPLGGTIEWDGDQTFDSEVKYGCSDLGSFRNESGFPYDSVTVYCLWSKRWSHTDFDPCICEFLNHIYQIHAYISDSHIFSLI